MKKLLTLLLFGFCLNACEHQPSPPTAIDQVNSLVGNAGYVAATGQAPTTAINDDARVQAHLAYAEQLLRQAPTVALSPKLAGRRARLLGLLHRYWVAGVFPRNYNYPGERRPCFIDRNGRLCAVGYLVAETVGRSVAERINQAHQYDLIADMHTPALAEWVNNSGLSGTGQLLVGAFKMPTDDNGGNWGGSNTDREARTFSLLNIGLGTATLALSTWNLVSHKQAKVGKTAVGVVHFPGQAGGTGLSLTRRF